MALVRKILETTLTAGNTSVTFTDTDIPNSLLRVYSSQASLFPISQTLSGNVLTVTYKAQANNVGIALEIVKQGLDIVDNVTSTDTDKALSANQGYVLKGLIDDIVIPTVPENITDLDDVNVTDIANGQVLAWNSTSEKFENVNQSGGGSNLNFPTDNTPIVVGKYGTRDIYRKRIYLSRVVTGSNDISSQLPLFDVLVGFHGYCKTGESMPRYMQINSDINTSNWWCGVLCYGSYNGSPYGNIWVGSPFNNGSAELWMDYVPPISS